MFGYITEHNVLPAHPCGSYGRIFFSRLENISSCGYAPFSLLETLSYFLGLAAVNCAAMNMGCRCLFGPRFQLFG